MTTEPQQRPTPFVIARQIQPGGVQSWQLQHPEWMVAAWGPLWLGLPIARAEQGLRRSTDGRAEGVFDGILLNDEQVQQRWQARGHELTLGDHRQLAIEELGAHGPRGLSDLRWHGAVAMLHRAQGVALLARDPLGVGWLGYQHDAQLELFTSDPRLACEAVPGGLAVRLDAKGWAAQAVRTAAEHAPYFRDLPSDLLSADLETQQRELVARLRGAVRACQRGCGGLTTTGPYRHEISTSLLGAGDGGSGVATALGLDSLSPAQWPEPTAGPRSGLWPKMDPPEPLGSADAVDRRARAWRATTLADVELRQARAQALDRDQWLLAPHLDPAVLAWLGALDRQRRAAVLSAVVHAT